MSAEKTYSQEQAHRLFAAQLFNQVWDLLEKESRSQTDDDLMINTAQASLYHWRQVGTPLHFQRGEWMVAHVYTILGMPESALHHAENCLSLTKEHAIDDFDLSFAYEAQARTSALARQPDEARRYYDLAHSSAAQIKKKDDRDYFLQVLEAGPWFGVR
jgi:tetratricopeptide (TPR) repeat protein